MGRGCWIEGLVDSLVEKLVVVMRWVGGEKGEEGSTGCLCLDLAHEDVGGALELILVAGVVLDCGADSGRC